ncbi:Pimeloyl-ACP methyl ester carboxylesterase [Sinosporangium album]|uniref:Pimeloyl-ACP methyl ester carboxylesterase n=1 Tax=Sinosporangium album TaxID=504805 RepID=A0A1G8II00_9ACTN|nr:alpha/beta hydrolase [Sinosporangium album]SDI18427.1 Pimeloyl-ACP methyl ester carboxylesterase [Sinosporangium album]
MSHRPSEVRPETAKEGSPPLGRYYDVGGRRLLLHRAGSGGPAVVFLPGGGTVGLDYLNVQERAAEFTTSVLYDRAGTGWSDRADLPRTSAEVTDELREVLRAAGIPAPYLLVGHSLGGFYARHYARRFPGEVAGMVLLDPAHEDYNSSMPPELVELWNTWDADQAFPDELPDELVQLYRGMFAQEMGDWPDTVRELLLDRHVSPEWFRVGFDEAKNVEELNEELRRTGPMPDVPLIILTAMGIDPFKRLVSQGVPESLLDAELQGKRRLYTALAGSVSHGENRIVEDVGHVTIHFRRPDAVTEAIRDLLGK